MDDGRQQPEQRPTTTFRATFGTPVIRTFRSTSADRFRRFLTDRQVALNGGGRFPPPEVAIAVLADARLTTSMRELAPPFSRAQQLRSTASVPLSSAAAAANERCRNNHTDKM